MNLSKSTTEQLIVAYNLCVAPIRHSKQTGEVSFEFDGADWEAYPAHNSHNREVRPTLREAVEAAIQKLNP